MNLETKKLMLYGKPPEELLLDATTSDYTLLIPDLNVNQGKTVRIPVHQEVLRVKPHCACPWRMAAAIVCTWLPAA